VDPEHALADDISEPSSSRTPGLVERERELARISSLLESARGGAGSVLVLEGEPGIGKTALMNAARERASALGMTVLAACGSEIESGFPFGLVRQCLEPLLASADGRERTRLLKGAAELAAPVVADAPAADRGASLGALHGLYWLLANVADRAPVLLVADDAHWSDLPSLRFLAYLTRRVDSLALGLVIATRPVPGDAPAGELIGACVADPNAERIEPAPLTEAAITDLVGVASDRRFASACHQATGGNPFLASELIRELAEQSVPFTAAGAERIPDVAPREIARWTRDRLARLPPEASALARALALLGGQAPLDLASELAALGQDGGRHAAESLTGAGFVEFDTALRFRHPLLGAAVGASVTPFERESGHRSAAALLRARGAPPEQIAVHILAAAPAADPDDERVLRDAANEATRRGAPGSAVPLLRRALLEPLADGRRLELLLELGEVERTAGLYPDAAGHLLDAVRLADDPELHAQAIVALARTVGPEPDRNRELLAPLRQALDAADSVDRELALRVKGAFLSAAFHAGQGDDPAAQRVAAEVAKLPGDSPGESIALSALFEHLHTLQSAAEFGSLAERVARHADELLAAGVQDARAHALLVGLRMADRLETAERLTVRWFELARAQGSEEAFGAASTHSANLNRLRGRLTASEADAAAAVTSSRTAGGVGLVMAEVALTDALLTRGKLDEAEATFAAIGIGEQVPPIRPFLGVLGVRVELRAARGDHAAALADFDEIVRRLGSHRPTGPQLGHLLTAIRSRHAQGEDQAVVDGLGYALEIAQTWGTDSAIGSVLRLRGRLADDPSEALEDLRAAVAHLERSPRRVDHARALVDLGSVLRRAARRVESREPLRAGFELARECGADGLAETARGELAASGVRIRRERLSGIESLTASERRIAELAADGLSNADIAQSLFVTVKTVEMHLTHTYRKLSVNGRAELSRVLAPAAR
jgi:DNA-binding CsgD family transcriptional regulator